MSRSRTMGVVSTRPKRWSRSSTRSEPAELADSDPPELDLDRVFAVFARHGIEYLLIGGVAGRLYGASRATVDIDVVARRDLDNLGRLADARRELGAFLRVGGLDDDTARNLPVILDAEALSHLEISTWRTNAGDLDVLADLRDAAGGHVSYETLRDRSSVVLVGGVEVPLASLDDIIASKRFADRDKDRSALPELTALRDRLARETTD